MTDFFERLPDAFGDATPDDRVDPVFAARLRARVERALGTDPTRVAVRLPARADATRPADAGTTRPTTNEPERTTTVTDTTRNDRSAQVITPYLCVHDARAALDWYREHFGAHVGDVIEWEGQVGHAELDVAGAVFYLSDEAPGLGVVAPERDGSRTSVSVVLQVAAVEEFVARAVGGGAVVQRDVEESHGSRNAWLVDPFGHRWNVATPTYTPEQIADRRSPSEPYYMTLTTADVERGAAFYGAVLGWETVEQGNGGRHVVNTEMPIGLRSPENPFGRTDPGQIEMWFTVRDFDDAVERVRVAGGTVVELNAWDSGREAICEDDQGVTFKLSEPAPGYDR
jgi:uncharacterized glyoxalase superfamily protein PhnB